MAIIRRAAEVLAAASLAGIFVTVAWNWSALPNRIPVHFNIHGQADGWGPKEMLIGLALIAFAAYATLWVVQQKPHLMNVPFAVNLENDTVRRLLQEMACVLKAAVMIVLFSITWANIQVALGLASELPSGFIALAVLLPMMPTIIYLARLRRP